MRPFAALLAVAALSACSSDDDQIADKGGKADPIVEQAQSLEKAADASVTIVEKDAQERIDAAKADDQAVSVTPEPVAEDKGK